MGISRGCVCSKPIVTFLRPGNLPNPKANILIDRNGRARISDFSLLTIAPDQSTFLSSCIQGGTIHWMSPELLDPESFDLKKIRPTKQSDCYALGMVIYEVLSGQTPFAPRTAPVVIRKVLERERPERPQGEEGAPFTDVIWTILEQCWDHSPGDRASARAVLLCLEGDLPSELPSSSNVDGDSEAESDDQLDATPSDSGTFSPFHLGFAFDHPCGISAPSITHGGEEPPDLPQPGHHTAADPEPGMFLPPHSDPQTHVCLSLPYYGSASRTGR